MIDFAYPYLLIAGLLFCGGLIMLYRRLALMRRTQLEKFVGSTFLDNLTRHLAPRRRHLKSALILLAVFLICTALARPQYGYVWTEIRQKGIDILIAIDTSKSMLAEDVKPNRLQRSRFAIMDFVKQLRGDRIGLIPFSGSAFLLCPLTLDYGAFNESLASVSPTIIPKGGTNIAALIREATAVLDNDASHKILVIVTDGENLQDDAIAEAENAHKKGVTIHTIGVGTPQGELIPLGAVGSGGFVKNDEGKLVTSRLDEDMLKRIAAAAGGIYAPLGQNQGFDTIYREKLALEPKKEMKEQREKVPIERASWCILAALVMLIIEYLLPEQKSDGVRFGLPIRQVFMKLRQIFPGTKLSILLLILVLGYPKILRAAESGQDAYRKNDFLAASERFASELKKHPESPVNHYNYATAAYKNNLFDEAISSFSQALKTDDLDLQAKSYFNLGNSQYQKGAETAQAQPSATREQWRKALEAYDSVLKLQPENQQARENRQLVAQQLENLENQPDQPEQKQNSGASNSSQPSDKKCDNPSDASSGQQNSADQSGQDKSADKQKEEKPADQERDASEKSAKEQPEAGSDKENGAQENQQADMDATSKHHDDQQRRILGKMTREEAEKLLDSLKNDEGEMRYAPAAPREHKVDKDW